MVTIVAPPQNWSNLQNKPTWIADDQANWGDIPDKPSSFPSSAHNHELLSSTTFVQSGAGNQVSGATSTQDATPKSFTITGLNYSNSSPKYSLVSGQSTNTENTVQIGGGWSILTPVQRIEFWLGNYNTLGPGTRVGYINQSDGLVISKITATNLPSSALGLPSGSFWRDSNGFVRIV